MIKKFIIFLALTNIIVINSRLLQDYHIVSNSPTITQKQQNIIFSLTNIAENSQIEFDYNYAEDIDDGRGITFGIIGFTSGTYDGTILISHIKELDPQNYLVKYLPAFQAIDKLPHPDGKTENIKGLSSFIKDWRAHGNEEKVRQAQIEKLKELYWNPTIKKANELGVKYALTVAELYDICVNHGADGDQNDKGLQQLVDETNKKIGSIRSGVDEKKWLNELYNVRKAYMKSDPTWVEAIDRVEMHRRILNTGNLNLMTPLAVKCYGDSFTIKGDAP